jgi:hypothetical protein
MVGKLKGQMKKAQLKRLHLLEKELAALREELGVSARGDMIFQSPRDMWSDDDIVVEADGSGGATLMIVEGNYPSDYTIHKHQSFKTEDEACEAAERLMEPIKPR